MFKSTTTLRPSASKVRHSTSRKAGEVTRERMLDAAEELFALHGFHGTSLRDVAARADAPIALVSYHFTSKDSLFDRVIERRASPMAIVRTQALEAARNAAAPQGRIELRLLIEAYVGPFIERSSAGGPGWKNYSQLVARLANSPAWTPVISKHYDATARLYIQEFCRTMPAVAEEDIYHAFNFMVGTMVATVAESRRVEHLSLGRHSAIDLKNVFEVMVPFLTAGFMALEQTANRLAPPSRAAPAAKRRRGVS